MRRVKQKGAFSLIAVLLTLVLIALALPTLSTLSQDARQRRAAEAAGTQLAQFNGALRAFLSDRGEDAITDLGCVVGAACTLTGTNWLKNSVDCAAATGTLTRTYLPCTFPDQILRSAVTTNVFARGAAPDTSVFAVVRMNGIVDRYGAPRLDLSARAATAANAATAGMGVQTVSSGGPAYAALNPLAGAFYSHYVFETGGAWTYDTVIEAPTPANNQIVAETSSTTSLDAWLRTDGSNQMNADLNMGGNDIINAGTINADAIEVVNDVIANDFIVNALGGQPVSTFWSNSTVVTQGNQIINQPTCPTGAVADGIFWALKKVYYPNGSPGVPGSQIGDISADAAYLTPISATQWQAVVEITSTNAVDPNTPVVLDNTNSDVLGVVLTRCITP